jgi:hypothetical protein
MVYTSYFGRLKNSGLTYRAVSVTIQQPPKFNLPVCLDLAPHFGLYYKFRRKKISEAKFAQLYKMKLDLLDPDQIAREMDGKILVSWEGYEDRKKTRLAFSHRHIIAEWLRAAGHECAEL